MHNLDADKCYIDLHVHTQRYSPCAELLDPVLLLDRLQNSKLSGIVITEHDKLWSKDEIRELNANLRGKRFYRGVEVSSLLGHFVAIGLESLDGIEPGISIEELTRSTRKKGAVLILVHHHLSNYAVKSPLKAQILPDAIDAIEVASTVTLGENQQEAERIAKSRGWIPVAGSDAHCIESVGRTCTVFPALPANEKELARAICLGLGIPIRMDAGIEP